MSVVSIITKIPIQGSKVATEGKQPGCLLRYLQYIDSTFTVVQTVVSLLCSAKYDHYMEAFKFLKILLNKQNFKNA